MRWCRARTVRSGVSLIDCSSTTGRTGLSADGIGSDMRHTPPGDPWCAPIYVAAVECASLFEIEAAQSGIVRGARADTAQIPSLAVPPGPGNPDHVQTP